MTVSGSHDFEPVIVDRAVHLATARIQHCSSKRRRAEERQRPQIRHCDHALAGSFGQTFHGRESDSNAGERSGTRRGGEAIHLIHFDVVPREQLLDALEQNMAEAVG